MWVFGRRRTNPVCFYPITLFIFFFTARSAVAYIFKKSAFIGI